MQKLATKIFIYSSLTFGVLGIIWVMLMSERGLMSEVGPLLGRVMMICVFIILPSFAVSFAGKYLMDRRGETFNGEK